MSLMTVAEITEAVNRAQAIWPVKTWTKAVSDQIYLILAPVVAALNANEQSVHDYCETIGETWGTCEEYVDVLSLGKLGFDNHAVMGPFDLAMAEHLTWRGRYIKRALPGPSGFVNYVHNYR
jgi:hypothetical protein